MSTRDGGHALRPRVGLAHVERLDELGVAERAGALERGAAGPARARGSSSGGTSRRAPRRARGSGSRRRRRASCPATSSSSGRQTTRPGREHLAAAGVDHRQAAGDSASSVDAPATGMPSVSASERAIARPMRMLVKLPGPRPTTIPSIVARVGDELVDRGEQVAGARGARRGRPARAPQTAPKEVAVSKAKIVFTVDPHAPVRLVDVAEGNGRARGAGASRRRARAIRRRRSCRRSTARGRPTPRDRAPRCGRGRGARPASAPRSGGRS